MDYFDDLFHIFMDLDSVTDFIKWDNHKPPGFHPKYLTSCSEDKQSFYGFGTT